MYLKYIIPTRYQKAPVRLEIYFFMTILIWPIFFAAWGSIQNTPTIRQCQKPPCSLKHFGINGTWDISKTFASQVSKQFAQPIVCSPNDNRKIRIRPRSKGWLVQKSSWLVQIFAENGIFGSSQCWCGVDTAPLGWVDLDFKVRWHPHDWHFFRVFCRCGALKYAAAMWRQ